jgi:hypothetical protein
MKAFRKGILSHHKDIGEGRYNRFEPQASAPNIRDEYTPYRNGWRRKEKKDARA